VLIVGERINTSRKNIRKAVEERNAAFIQEEARKQMASGATMIDVNAGTSVTSEIEDLKWLVNVVQEAVKAPLCIDSPNPAALAAALPLHKNGQPMINSITAESARLAAILPLVKKYDTLVVGLAMGDSGMPSGVDDRLAAVRAIASAVRKEGLPLSKVYYDPVICPVSTKQTEADAAVQTVRYIMTNAAEGRELAGAHTICGLSNVSFGLPKRVLINRTYLTLMMAAGIDGLIIDPTEPQMINTYYATRVLLGKDDFCMEYITADREGKLGQ
jgi:5-methyltetrahydrofolate--homocysteine methyltransferase